jgi:flagellar biosynthesis protein FlhG
MNLDERGQVIAIASGKGGVGKTFFSITLAHQLAALGQRVLLFDGDIGLANIDVQLGISPERDLASVFSGKATLEEVIMPYKPGKFDIVAGRSGSGGLALLPASNLKAFTHELMVAAQAYDFLLLDLSAGVDPHVRTLSAISDRCLVLVTDEPTSLTDSYAFLKLTHKDTPEVRLEVVVNQAESKTEGEQTYRAISKACQSFLNMTPPLLGMIRKDPRVREAVRHQTALTTRSPESPAALDVEAIAKRLVND